MLSKQRGTAPPRLRSPDRPSLDYQAGKRLTADCLETSVSSEAQGSARQVSSVRGSVCVCVCVWEEGEIAVSRESYTVREYDRPTAQSSSD